MSYMQIEKGIHMTTPKTPPNDTAVDIKKGKKYWELDGETHINIHYKQSKSELGKMLAPYAVYPFTHSYLGPFKTMEGFLHYLQGGCKDDRFRSLIGDRAKRRFMEGLAKGTYQRITLASGDRYHILLLAHYEKINQNPVIKSALIDSTLPFDQYFLHGPGNVPIRPRDTDELVRIFEELRILFKNNEAPSPYDYSRLQLGSAE